MTWPRPIRRVRSTRSCIEAVICKADGSEDLSPDVTACFTYGSLMWADIMAIVCGRRVDAHATHPPFDRHKAWLSAHVRLSVRDQDYPGLRPAISEEGDVRPVEGVLYRGLSDSEFNRLDAFEGAEYERVLVSVQVEGHGEPQAAWVYRFREDVADRLLPQPWDPEQFEREGKARFMQRHVGFLSGPST